MYINKTFYQQILSSDEKNSFIRTFYKKNWEKLLEFIFQENQEVIINDEKLNLAFSFFIHSYVNIVFDWLQDKFDISSEELVEEIIDNMPGKLKPFIF